MKRYTVMVRRTDALYYDVDAESEQEAKDKVEGLLEDGVLPDLIDDFLFDDEIIDVIELEESPIRCTEEEDEMIRARIPAEMCKEFKKYCIDKNTTIQDAIAFMISKVLK